MTHLPFLIAGWGIVFAVCGLYAMSVLKRARRVGAKVPVERARWMTGKDADVIGES